MHDKNNAKINAYIHEAETRTEPPPLPKQGLINQWVPGFIRWPIRLLTLPFIWLDCAAQKLARKIIRPPFRTEGHCLKRGNCCYYIIMPAPKRLLARINYFWQTQINGFYYRDEIAVEGHDVHVMGCRYLNKDGSCNHHTLRPKICREWPRIEYFERPKILKGCGYKAVSRNQAPKGPKSPFNVLQK